jgi:hypothetical protein
MLSGDKGSWAVQWAKGYEVLDRNGVNVINMVKRFNKKNGRLN